MIKYFPRILRNPSERKLHAQTYWVILLGFITLFPWMIAQSDLFGRFSYPEPLNASHPPMANHVVMLLIDGLGINSALHPGWMPHLEDRIPNSAFGTALASFPTVTTYGIRTLMSGRHPFSTFILNNRAGPTGVTHEYDSVIARAAAARRKIFVFGPPDWGTIFSGHGAFIKTFPHVQKGGTP